MTRPINASLFISGFLSTGNPGEYTFENAVFNNQADATNNGAGDATVGSTIFVSATDVNSLSLIPGVFHRYRITALTVVDFQTLSGTLIWDEPGLEADMPTSNTACMFSQVTPNHGYSVVPLDTVYSGMPGGMTSAALVLDNRDVSDNIGMAAVNKVVLVGATTDELTVTLSNLTAMVVPTGKTVAFSVNIVGTRLDQPNQRCVFYVQGSAYINPLTSKLVMDSTLTMVLARADTSWYATAEANSTTGAIDILVNGSVGASLTWSATLELTFL